MTTHCDLCKRPTARQALTATWYPHLLCDRRSCRQAARESVEAVNEAREKYRDLADAIAARHDGPAVPVGYRSDAMAEIDVVDEEEWWANEVVKRV